MFSPSQKQIGNTIYNEAKKYTKYPDVVTCIGFVESSFGVHLVGDLDKNIYSASLGVLQFRLQTAKEVIGWRKELKYMLKYSDVKLVSLLITNHKLSAKLGALRLEHYRKKKGLTKAISAHNGGYKNKTYIRKVQKCRQWLFKRDK